MVERLSADARAIVAAAAGHARRLGHRWIGCEHLLLAAAGHGDPTSDVLNGLGLTPGAVETTIRTSPAQPASTLDAQALAAFGIDLDAVRQRVEAAFGAGALTRPEPPHCQRPRRLRRRRRPECEAADDASPFTPRAKQCLDLALQQARAHGRSRVDTHDLASALTAVPGSMSLRILNRLGVAPERVRNGLGSYRQTG